MKHVYTMLILYGLLHMLFTCSSGQHTTSFHDDKIYIYSNFKSEWKNAYVNCFKIFNADLMVINSRAMQENVQKDFRTSGSRGDYWIALQYTPTTAWIWPGNKSPIFTNWGTGNRDTNASCAAISTKGVWKALPCNKQLPYICYGNYATHNASQQYFASTTKLRQHDAENVCDQAGKMKLVAILSAHDQRAVENTIAKNNQSGYYIGLKATPAPSAAYEYGAEVQTVEHIAMDCPKHLHPYGTNGLADFDDETQKWLLDACPNSNWAEWHVKRATQTTRMRRHFFACKNVIGGYMWNDETNLTESGFSNWAVGYPNVSKGDCVVLSYGTNIRKWKNMKCSSHVHQFICQRQMELTTAPATRRAITKTTDFTTTNEDETTTIIMEKNSKSQGMTLQTSTNNCQNLNIFIPIILCAMTVAELLVCIMTN